MTKTFLLTDSKSFTDEFYRCCDEYESVDLAVAGCGNPKHTLPYKRLERFGSSMRVTVGVSFEQTHPDGIEWLIAIDSDLRIFRKKNGNIFHPKIYLFQRENKFALFVGSSNLTYSGFYRNVETNVLIEGNSENENVDLVALRQTLDEWRSDICSFLPTKKWFENYTKLYLSTFNKARQNNIQTPPTEEDDISAANWLSQADWNVYQTKIFDGIRKQRMTIDDCRDFLNEVCEELALPWNATIFHDLNNRRIIGGMQPYAWLGHVAASGNFRKIMANTADNKTQRAIANTINEIASLKVPIDWTELEVLLNKLTAIGPTMKVWSRLLCLVKPDTYCTVASLSVRANMSKTLGMAQASIETPKGYIRVLKLIHGAPWFHSKRPRDLINGFIWDNRVVLMDVIFYG